MMCVKKAFPYAITVWQLQIRNQHDRFSNIQRKHFSLHNFKKMSIVMSWNS